MEEITKPGFKELGLSNEVNRAIEDMGFEEPSAIQAEIIPVLLSGSDAIGQAQTGTGKTLAFGAPMLSIIGKPKGHVSGIVLCPTRELAVQVSDELSRLAKYTKLKMLPVFGGAPIDRQIRALRDGVDIIVGTPGRVIDLIDRKVIKLDKINFFVLDEADEMLNMGFIEDIETILETSNTDRQTMLFSATMPKRIKILSKDYLKDDAEHIVIEKSTMTVATTEQYYFEVKHRDRFESLCRILDSLEYTNVIIFCNTKRNVDDLTEHLKNRGYKAEAMHGDIKQVLRLKTLGRFRDGSLDFLVATDVAARGIDVENISHVVNYDLPQDIESYVHRIGRTGRAGRDGIALTLVTPREYMDLKQIEKFTNSVIKRSEIPTLDEILENKLSGIMKKVDAELESGDYKKLVPQVLNLDDSYNLAEVAAALLSIYYKDEMTYDYKENKIGGNVEFQRLFMTVGKMDKLTPVKLLNFFTEQAKTHGDDIGNIDMAEKFTFVDVNKAKVQDILDNCNGKKFCGRKLAIEISDGTKGNRKKRSSEAGGKSMGGARARGRKPRSNSPVPPRY